MTKLLTKNKKMKKSTGLETKNFGIPALRIKIDDELQTLLDSYKAKYNVKDLVIKNGYLYLCPMAGKCAGGCYALEGTYSFGNVQNAYKFRLLEYLRDKDQFFANVRKQLGRAKRIRVHDSGDFFSSTYFDHWINFATSNSDIQLYAYTKRVDLVKSRKDIPENFTFILSEGGKLDKDIDTSKDRHSRVFTTSEELESQGYINASNDDNLATVDNKKVGLVWHGISTKKQWETANA